MNTLQKLNHFIDDFFQILYRKNKVLCYIVTLLFSLLISFVIQYLIFDEISFISSLCIGIGVAINIGSSAYTNKRDKLRLKRKIKANRSQQPRRVVLTKVCTYFCLAGISGLILDLIVEQLKNNNETQISSYTFLYFLGYWCLMPLLVSITNREHVGAVYEKYTTFKTIKGLPWYYPLGFISAFIYAIVFDQLSGIVISLLLSAGTIFHIYHCLPPVVKQADAKT